MRQEKSELALALDKLVLKHGYRIEDVSWIAGLGRGYLAKVINGNRTWLIEGDPPRSEEFGAKLADMFSLTEPHRTFFLGLCGGKSLDQLSRELETRAPLDFVRFVP